MVTNGRRWLFVALAGCGGGGSGNVDAPLTIVDAPPDAKVWLDAPPPEFDFSCMTNPPPTTANANITGSGTIRRIEFNGSIMFNPLDGASVRVCKAPGAPDCNTTGNQLGSTVTTANGGLWSITFPSGGQPADVYVEMTEATSRTTFAFPDQPLTMDAMADLLTFTPQVIAALSLVPNGCTQSAGNALIGLAVIDCANQPIADTANLTLSIKQGGNEVTGTTTMDLGAVNGAAAGLFLICNVPPNNVTTVGASWKGMALRPHDVKTVAGTTSQTIVRPGYK
ncbi:MAG TPA: hypothetical protein VFV99_15950 [Kofleriaceae bacterium]|nr:hypothetical protein [Kofleriaceae bacterium]